MFTLSSAMKFKYIPNYKDMRGGYDKLHGVVCTLAGKMEDRIINMKITQAILDDLTAKAKASPRLRMNLDLRNSAEDQSQRMLNAIEPGSPLPIHRHRHTSETVVCLRGRLVWEFYDELERICTETIELSPNGRAVALNIPAGQWHTVRALESGSVILEMKEGRMNHCKMWIYCHFKFVSIVCGMVVMGTQAM